MFFEFYVRFHMFYLSSGNCVAACWETAAKSAYDMFSKCGYQIVKLDFPTLVSGLGICF